jgi:hypothetical protein
MPSPPPAPWRWAALLGFALVAPVGLPAGGADRRQPELRRRAIGEPLLSAGSLNLQTAPHHQAPALAHLASDQPMRVLRSWRSDSGERWLQVDAAAGRGWLIL